MKRGSESSGKLRGAGRCKAASPRRPISAESPTTRRSTENNQMMIARLSRERDEAIEREKAAAEVLNVINTSPTDPQPVFDTIIRSAVRLCAAQFGVLH